MGEQPPFVRKSKEHDEHWTSWGILVTDLCDWSLKAYSTVVVQALPGLIQVVQANAAVSLLCFHADISSIDIHFKGHPLYIPFVIPYKFPLLLTLDKVLQHISRHRGSSTIPDMRCIRHDGRSPKRTVHPRHERHTSKKLQDTGAIPRISYSTTTYI